MRRGARAGVHGLATVLFAAGAQAAPPVTVADLAEVADGWQAEVVAEVDQSYAGWDVSLGDADNDGRTEILTVSAPDSRLRLTGFDGRQWTTRVIADRLAGPRPGMGLAVRVVDLDHDGRHEVLVGTGQEDGRPAFLHLLEIDGTGITRRLLSQPYQNESAYTHGLAVADIDHDGLDEIVATYCGGGEIVRYDVDAALTGFAARKVHHLSGSGEASLFADVDNDGALEYLTANGFRAGAARVEIFELDARGELERKPRLVIADCEGQRCFYASLQVGDVDNDGRNELVVGWKKEQTINRSTLLAYRVDRDAAVAYVLDRDTPDLDLGYFEKMLVIADADNDGRNELIVTTRGDGASEQIASEHLGHVYRYDVEPGGVVRRQLLVDFHEACVESSWPAVGDADGDGRNEIILATGKGDRTLPGTSWILLVRHP